VEKHLIKFYHCSVGKTNVRKNDSGQDFSYRCQALALTDVGDARFYVVGNKLDLNRDSEESARWKRLKRCMKTLHLGQTG
jgi:hypothetical protein